MSAITVARRSILGRRAIYDATRGDMTGSGQTAATAKADLESQIDTALTGTYEPRIVTHRGHSALVYRTPSGWQYALLREQVAESGIHGVGFISSAASRERCLQSAAHLVISAASGPDDIYDDADIPAFLEDAELRDTLISCFRFYRAHRWAKNNGIVGDLHRWACEHNNEFRFTMRPPNPDFGGAPQD